MVLWRLLDWKSYSCSFLALISLTMACLDDLSTSHPCFYYTSQWSRSLEVLAAPKKSIHLNTGHVHKAVIISHRLLTQHFTLLLAQLATQISGCVSAFSMICIYMSSESNR
ncbi:hypothetical protein BJV82DRAFT_629237 [Fennellomyces sp. T-0311]|nr:hypothetical protein BJV82DRAFT_629237 [Fennellomyces sp. T-0311]